MSKKLRIVPLGGLGEIGKNMMAYEYGENILVVDTGIMFPENDMLGIDYIIPDFQYLSEKQAINYKAGISGPDKPYTYIENSHLSITYRQNILRKWLFYEITPEINWDKSADTERRKEVSITLRLEVLFKNF